MNDELNDKNIIIEPVQNDILEVEKYNSVNEVEQVENNPLNEIVEMEKRTNIETPNEMNQNNILNDNVSIVEIKNAEDSSVKINEENNHILNDDSIIKASDFMLKDDLDIFVGKHSDAIIYKKYSFLSGILGELWLLYRKCYIPGIILGILNCLFAAYVLFLTETPIYLYFIVRFILYFVISREIYITSAKKKIKKIEQVNISISQEELANKIQKKGGTCILVPIIYIFSIIVIVVGIFFYIYKFGTYNFNNLEIRSEGWGINESNQLVYTASDKTCIASIYYSKKDDQSVNTILYQKGVINEQQYLEQSYDLSQFEKETINDNDWYKTTITDTNNLSEDMLISEKDDYIYLVNLKGENENDYQACQEIFNDLKVRFKFR